MTLTAEQVNRARAKAIAAGWPRLHSIIHQVCDQMGAKVADAKNPDIRTAAMNAIRVRIYLLADEAGFDAKAIASVMRRDRSTIYQVLKSHKAGEAA